MEVFTELRSYPQDPPRFFDFSRFADEAGDFVLVPGLIDFAHLEQFKGRRVVYLEFEEPNRFFAQDPGFHHQDYEDYLWRVFTICPYTARWLNARQGTQKRTPIFFPFNEGYAPQPTAKEFDVIYTGQILAPQLQDIVAAISRFDYRLVSYSYRADERVTHTDATYAEKLALISRARVTVVANLVYPGSEHIKTVRKIRGYRDNEAFRLIPSARTPWLRRGRYPVAPQVKSRLFEAAFCGSLILCQRDIFGIVERFFTPDEFVYYADGRLEETLEAILSNYERYLPVIERARTRAFREYTTAAFFARFLRHL